MFTMLKTQNFLFYPTILLAVSFGYRVTTIFQKQEDCAYQKNRLLARWEFFQTPIGLFFPHLVHVLFQFCCSAGFWTRQWCFQILRRPRMAGNKIMGMITEPYRLTRRCEVTAILILYGLPRWNINLLFCIMSQSAPPDRNNKQFCSSFNLYVHFCPLSFDYLPLPLLWPSQRTVAPGLAIFLQSK
jgi:hypothetical protein